jgi:microcystin-dependent protein
LAEFEVGYPIKLGPDGDRTQEALYKGAVSEVAKIYDHLNELARNAGFAKSGYISAAVNNRAQLPLSADLGAITLLRDTHTLVIFDGYGWKSLTVQAVPKAAPSKHGQARLGATASLDSAGPSSLSVVTTEMLNVYKTDTSKDYPPGAVILWASDTPPEGWALCDGQNGTPDLRGRFVKAASLANQSEVAGSNTKEIEAADVTSHYHEFILNGSLPEHTHTLEQLTDTASTSHGHDATVTIAPGASGSHSHNTSYTPPVQYAYGTGPRYGKYLWEIRESGASGNHTHIAQGPTSFSTVSAAHTHDVASSVTYARDRVYTATIETGNPSYAGVPTQVNVEPPYIVMAYIMKVRGTNG